MAKEPIQPQDKYMVRFPEGMRDRLKKAAADNKRSMNAEIISRLSDTLDRHPEEMKGAWGLIQDLRKEVQELEAQLAHRTDEMGATHEGAVVELPDDLAEAIARAGSMQGRSMEAQAVHTLDTAYSHPRAILERKSKR